MAVTQQEPIAPEKKPAPPKMLEELVRKQIGNVPNLQSIQCIPLFEDRYRVNVRVLKECTNFVKVSKIAASYFLKFADNKIIGGDEIKPLV